MANNVRAWSTTAASNGSADADINAAEGCPPSSVNDAERQMMAKLKNTLVGIEFLDHGVTATYISATSFASPGDLTAVYLAGRRLQFGDSSTLYGTIRSVSYVAANTTVTVVLDSGSLSASLATVSPAILAPTNISKPGIFSKDTYALTTGAATALVADPVPAVPTLTTGHTITIRTHTSVGAAPNINVSGLGEKLLRGPGNAVIAAGAYGADVFLPITYESSLSAWLINGGAAGSVTFPAQIFATGGDTLTATQGTISIFNGTAATSVTLPQATALSSGFIGEQWHHGADVTLTLNAKTADTLYSNEYSAARSAIDLNAGDGATITLGTANSLQVHIDREPEWIPIATYSAASSQSALYIEILNLETLGAVDLLFSAVLSLASGAQGSIGFQFSTGSSTATVIASMEGVIHGYNAALAGYEDQVSNAAQIQNFANNDFYSGADMPGVDATVILIGPNNTAIFHDWTCEVNATMTAGRTFAGKGAGKYKTLGPIKLARFGGGFSGGAFTKIIKGRVRVKKRRARY